MSGRVLLPADVTPCHYALELIPDLDLQQFQCNEEIFVDVHEAVNEITLHQKEISVLSASFKSIDSGMVINVNEFSCNTKLSTLKLVFEGSLIVGPGIVSIKYNGILNGEMAGFYKSTYTDSNGVKKIMASTQFEALDARRAFPCWDEPAVKATFSVTMVIPSHLTALSNMPEVSCTHLAGGKKRVVFDKSPKMSTYLLAWAVGEFDFVHGVTKNNIAVRVFSPPGRAEQGRFALDVGIRSLDFFDEFFQVPYPLPKMDMLCVTEFAAGAMENWGLVTYREVALMIDDATASSQSKQRVATVVAHELAHQWFGNLVTMSWWDGLWLNEGFANYMQHFAVDALFPDYKLWEQYTLETFSGALRLDAMKSSHPVIVPIKHAEEVEQVFDAISYNKGSTVVRMVEAIVGKEKFREGLQVYMKRHAYGNTETPDLWNAWSEVSGKDVAGLMSTWTTVMGYPYLKVVNEVWGEKEVAITLEQARFLSDGSAVEDSNLWSIPLLFATASEDSKEAVIMDQRVQTFAIPLSAAGGDKPWIKINAGQKALVRVAHSAEMISRLGPAVTENLLSPVDRAALLLDAYALAKAGLAPLETVVDILRLLQNEESSVVWDAISGVLNGFHTLLEQLGNPDVFEKFSAFGKAMVVTVLAKVGWDAKPADTHSDKLLRATVIGLLDTFAWQDEAVAAEAKRRFDAHWTDASVLPSDYKTTVYRIVLMNGGSSEYNALIAAYNAADSDHDREYVMMALGAAADSALKRRALDWAVKSGDVKLQDIYTPVAGVAGSGATGTELAWGYLQENFDLIAGKVAKAAPAVMNSVIVSCISRFCTNERADEVDAFFRSHPLPNSVQRISQCLENTRASGQFLERIRRSELAEGAIWEA